ncbi:GNAT family N-acetyltransferase (plasmid) [Bacillus sp. 31A1R]|uniref:GNAT family N-acetyltransferase n=1 Tax=Robertmurraya mangrovi TaxID=3098077 RepID=A0ABU5IUT5_9BACI|nr:GNAT family N-acetyltransferase [Bacillus sp. 31A1R]MDZ5470900.1 GNAT family N-acetyltransferase [Bacillus sp. 31A1R]
MKLIESNPSLISIELEIMNSHPYHNLVSEGRKLLTEDDMMEEHEESSELNKERYLIEYVDKYIGIVDFIMKNPRDDKPWLGLFIIHQDWTGKGLSEEAFNVYESLMKSRGIKEVRLGCFVNNERGLHFWKKQKFEIVKEIEFKDKPMYVLEKKLG